MGRLTIEMLKGALVAAFPAVAELDVELLRTAKGKPYIATVTGVVASHAEQVVHVQAIHKLVEQHGAARWAYKVELSVSE